MSPERTALARLDMAALPGDNDRIIAVLQARGDGDPRIVRIAYKNAGHHRLFIDAQIVTLAKPINYGSPLEIVIHQPGDHIDRLILLSDILSLEVLG